MDAGDPIQAQGRRLAAPRPRRPRRRTEVQLSRCPLRAGAGFGARVDRTCRRRRHRQGAAAVTGHRGRQPRRSRWHARNWIAMPTWEEIAALVAGKEEILLNCVDPETEERMKAEVDTPFAPATPSAASLKWWFTARPPESARTPTGTSGSTASWPGRSCHCRPSRPSRLAAESLRHESFGSEVHDAIGYSGPEHGRPHSLHPRTQQCRRH